MIDRPPMQRSVAQPDPATAEAPAPDASDPEPPKSPTVSPTGSAPLLSVDIVSDEADWSAFGDPDAAIDAAAAALAAKPGLIPAATVAVIALSSDAEVARLNATYRNKPNPTNVLSFPASPLPPGRRPDPDRDEPRALGDIILARETLLTEAASLGIPPVHHLQHLVIHGLLHLLGYDHETEPGTQAMESIETAVLATLGIPDPYADAPPEVAPPHGRPR